MKKVLVPMAFATLLLSACSASVTPSTDDGMTTSSESSVMMEESSSSADVSAEVDAGAAMEATSSEAAAQ